MLNKLDFTTETLQSLVANNPYDEHLTVIGRPRLQFLLRIKQAIDNDIQLDWQLCYSPINKQQNGVEIWLNDPRKKFAFYFRIPINQRYELKLYLGNNTFNFFEAHPLLIEKGVITKDEFKIKATSRELPHLVLSDASMVFPNDMVDETKNIQETSVYKNVFQQLKRFHPALTNIITAKWLL